jgi:hypothetical protein
VTRTPNVAVVRGLSCGAVWLFPIRRPTLLKLRSGDSSRRFREAIDGFRVFDDGFVEWASAASDAVRVECWEQFVVGYEKFGCGEFVQFPLHFSVSVLEAFVTRGSPTFATATISRGTATGRYIGRPRRRWLRRSRQWICQEADPRSEHFGRTGRPDREATLKGRVRSRGDAPRRSRVRGSVRPSTATDHGSAHVASGPVAGASVRRVRSRSHRSRVRSRSRARS